MNTVVKQQVFILAAGRHRTWSAPYPPQLSDIGGEPLIVRTLRQLQECSEDEVGAIVVTGNPAIAETVGDRAEVFDPGPLKRWMAETITSTIPLWDAQRITFAMGDVIFSDEAIAAILAERGEVHLYAAPKREAFAFTFDIGQAAFVKTHLSIALEDALLHRGSGHVWELYRSCCGLDLHVARWDDRIWRPVTDYTDDMDKVGQLRDFWKRNPWAAPEGDGT